jgi:hypothetical protein
MNWPKLDVSDSVRVFFLINHQSSIINHQSSIINHQSSSDPVAWLPFPPALKAGARVMEWA